MLDVDGRLVRLPPPPPRKATDDELHELPPPATSAEGAAQEPALRRLHAAEARLRTADLEQPRTERLEAERLSTSGDAHANALEARLRVVTERADRLERSVRRSGERTADLLREVEQNRRERLEAERLSARADAHAAALENELRAVTEHSERLERRIRRARDRADESERQTRGGDLHAGVPNDRSHALRGRPSTSGRLRRLAPLVLSAGVAVLATAAVLVDSDEAATSHPPAALLALQRPLYAGVSEEAQRDIPSHYLRLYKAAAERYEVDWAVLAAIGKIESDHGRTSLPGVKRGRNTAGAAGPMQFTRKSWIAYGIDADGEGDIRPHDPDDAVFAAASYLRASGAADSVHRAVLSYNPEPSYVRSVLTIADQYSEPSAQD